MSNNRWARLRVIVTQATGEPDGDIAIVAVWSDGMMSAGLLGGTDTDRLDDIAEAGSFDEV